MGTVRDLGQFQIGWEGDATPGTAVAAAEVLAIEDLQVTAEDPVERPRIAQGLALASPGQEYIPYRGTQLVVPATPAFFEQFQFWMNMGIVETGSPSGGPTDYTWAATRDPTAVPDPLTATIERRKTDGAAPYDEEWAYVFAERLRLSAAMDSAIMLEADLRARRRQSSTLTAAQSLPTGLEAMVGVLSTVYLDDSWANLGNTQLSNKIIGWSWEFRTGLMPYRSADGRTDRDFTGHWLNPPNAQLLIELTCLVDATTQAAQLAIAEAATLRALRLNVAGSANRALTLDQLVKYEQGSLQTIGEQDGQDIVTLRFREATDGTNLLAASLVNQIAALPS